MIRGMHEYIKFESPKDKDAIRKEKKDEGKTRS
jgi:hypothetical protein